MIKSVRIKNLRSLADTGYISIKPITLLLGANSSGKSTFLRSFPLLTQSVNKVLRGPISWFDDSLVDFGDYNTAFNRFANSKDKIQFFYHIKYPFNVRYYRPDLVTYDRLFKKNSDFRVSFSLSDDNKGTYISSVNFDVGNLCISLSIQERSSKILFSVNGMNVSLDDVNLRWNAATYRSILPSFEYSERTQNQLWSHRHIHSCFRSSIVDFVKGRSDKRLKSDSRVDAIISKWEFDRTNYLTWLKKDSPIPSFKKYIVDWTEDNVEFLELYNKIALYMLLPMWDDIDMELTSFYLTCSYIAPTRAEANRYYRTQGLQVNDIDPYGKNLQEFISSLSPSMLHSYNHYTQTTLGIQARTKTETGHQSIMVQSERGEYNITDVGFGYSQILPIITKLWYAMNKRLLRKRKMYYPGEDDESVILMEQPELHLHPAYQAKIADAFVNAISAKKVDGIRLIIETHSDTILNRIGRRVREGVIKPDDVNIVLFEKKDGEQTTQLRQTTYNSKGQIVEWPYGFFDPLED
jgi:hypothetical protein